MILFQRFIMVMPAFALTFSLIVAGAGYAQDISRAKLRPAVPAPVLRPDLAQSNDADLSSTITAPSIEAIDPVEAAPIYLKPTAPLPAETPAQENGSNEAASAEENADQQDAKPMIDETASVEISPKELTPSIDAPRERPAEFEVPPKNMATIDPPKARPKAIANAIIAPAPAPAPASAPSVTEKSNGIFNLFQKQTYPQPSTYVAKKATDEGSLDENGMVLLGIFGKTSNLKAMVQLSNGRLVEVGKGDRLGSAQVTAVSKSRVSYVSGGKTKTLTMP